MTPWNRLASLLLASATLGLAAPDLSAAIIAWQGGTGAFTSSNYSTSAAVENLAPAAGDRINFGSTGTGTLSTGTPHSFQRLYVGGSGNVPNPAGSPANIALPRGGSGTLTVDNGSQLNLTAGAAGSDNAGLTIGRVQNGVLTIDGANSSVTSNQLIVIGYAGGQPTRSGTVHVTNGGSLISTNGNINMGDSPNSGDVGMQGHLFVNGTVSAVGTGADLNIGIRQTGATVTQTGGAINIADVIEVGFSTGNNVNSSFSISGGATTHGGNFFVGRGSSSGATVNINGGTINTGNRYLMGAGTATGIVTNHTAGTLNTVLDVRVGDAGSGDATYNLSGTGVINSTTGGHVGRQGTGKVIQTGGTANFTGTFNIGNREGQPLANNGLYKISAGNANFGANLNISTSGVGEFRVIGDDGSINVLGAMNIANGVNGNSTLAYQLESGDSLSMITVAGVATFSSGSSLILDATNAAPNQSVYDLLTASSIVDNGISFTGPAAYWTYRIISGGNGQILQAIVPEPGTFVLALVASVASLRCRRR